MDKPCPSSGAVAGAGVVTTYYADDSCAARTLALANMAWRLSGAAIPGPRAGVPVLMIDWNLAAPGLHHLFGGAGTRPGLLEFFTACRAQLAALAHGNTAADSDELARQVLAAVDWRAYIEPAAAGRPLYLMRAGRVDTSFGARAAQLDWHALFQACPALLRQWRAQMAQAFRHVLIDAPGARSAAVSVCTSLLPDRIVGLFTPAQSSLDALCGVMRRAIAYRCSHEEEQRPLLLYPLPCAPAGADRAALAAWRHGARGAAGYQAVLEQLMQEIYGRTQLALDSYCDHVLLAPADEGHGTGAGPALQALLDWAGEGHFPWQTRAELSALHTHASESLPGGPAGPHRPRDEAGLRHGQARFGAVQPHGGRDVRRGGSVLRHGMATLP